MFLFANAYNNVSIFNRHKHHSEFISKVTNIGYECFESLDHLLSCYRYSKGCVYQVEKGEGTTSYVGGRVFASKVKIIKQLSVHDIFETGTKDAHTFLLNDKDAHKLLTTSEYLSVLKELVKRCDGDPTVIHKLAVVGIPAVRIEVARRYGKECQNILISDDDDDVLIELAIQKLQLPRLVESDNPDILVHVARHGYGVATLWQHPNDNVAATALDYIVSHLTAEGEFICLHDRAICTIYFDVNDKDAMDALCLSVKNRHVLASNGIAVQRFLKDPCPHVRIAAHRFCNTVWDKICIYFLELRHGKKDRYLLQ